MLPKIKEIPRIKNIIHSSKTFFLTLHMMPDADSCGSMLCFYEFLKKLGKKVYLYSYDRMPQNLSVLPYVDKIKYEIDRFDYDVGIFFESSKPSRSGIEIERFSFKKIINIDHHATSLRYGDVNVIYPEFPSTSEIIWRILKSMRVKLTKTMAINLYCGIITDTGRFQYSKTLPETLKVAADLMKYDFDFQSLNENFFSKTTYKNLKLLSVALSTLEILDGIASMFITKSDFERYNADFVDTENIINYPMMIEDVKAAFLVKEDVDKYNVTFRSRGNLDVSKIAARFGGGGHKNASGFKVSKDKFESIEDLIGKVRGCLLEKIKSRI